MQVMHHRGFVQVGKFRHIIRFVKLGGIDPVNLVGLHFPLLSQCQRMRGFSIRCSSYLSTICLYQ
jgi:hypothetical protein